MDSNEFRHWSLKAADWGADYRDTLRDRPVRPQVEPGEILATIAPPRLNRRSRWRRSSRISRTRSCRA